MKSTSSSFNKACMVVYAKVAVLLFGIFILLPDAYAESKIYTFNLSKTIEPELSFKLISSDGSDISLMNEVNFSHTVYDKGSFKYHLEAKFLEGAKIDSNIIDKEFDIKVERTLEYSVDGKTCSSVANSCPNISTVGMVNETPSNHLQFDHTTGKPILDLKRIKSNLALAGFLVTHQRALPFSAGYYTEQWAVTITPAL